MQKYRCHDCYHVWQALRDNSRATKNLYNAYASGRRTVSELSKHHGVNERTIRRKLDRFTPVKEQSKASNLPVALTFDATYFGRGDGYFVYRACGKTIHWQHIESETLAVVREGIESLIAMNWRFSSVTLDGRRGYIQLLQQLLPRTPIQLCLFHQKAIIRRYTTMRPKTDCGKAILALSNDLLSLDKLAFLERLEGIKKTFKAFLGERNELKAFKHRRLRSALRSFTQNAEYLFAWKVYPRLKIPNTTNSCDGSFAHWKAKVTIHRGLKKSRKHKMIEYLIQKS